MLYRTRVSLLDASQFTEPQAPFPQFFQTVSGLVNLMTIMLAAYMVSEIC